MLYFKSIKITLINFKNSVVIYIRYYKKALKFIEMKHLKYFVLITSLALFTNCGTSKTVKQSKKTLKGYWTLIDVSYDRPGTYNVNLFNDASEDCMEGSTWRFISNNNFGNYELSGTGCASEKRYFIWKVDETGTDVLNYDILVKPTDEKKKSITNTGFRINIAYLGDDQLQMTQTVNVEGKPFKITMNFEKSIE